MAITGNDETEFCACECCMHTVGAGGDSGMCLKTNIPKGTSEAQESAASLGVLQKVLPQNMRIIFSAVDCQQTDRMAKEKTWTGKKHSTYHHYNPTAPVGSGARKHGVDHCSQKTENGKD